MSTDKRGYYERGALYVEASILMVALVVILTGSFNSGILLTKRDSDIRAIHQIARTVSRLVGDRLPSEFTTAHQTLLAGDGTQALDLDNPSGDNRASVAAVQETLAAFGIQASDVYVYLTLHDESLLELDGVIFWAQRANQTQSFGRVLEVGIRRRDASAITLERILFPMSSCGARTHSCIRSELVTRFEG